MARIDAVKQFVENGYGVIATAQSVKRTVKMGR